MAPSCGVANFPRPTIQGAAFVGKRNRRPIRRPSPPIALRLGSVAGVLEAPPLSRVWRASGRGAHKMIGVDARFGIVRLMFIIQSSGTPRTDNESLSRAMLYAELGTSFSRSRR
ncbi:hypothetical protein MINTMi198_28900 [Mycobacterium intracellulare M.i.198]|nr:hypothetical protein MINTMi198_28900 [Mycobacterium intracellulare M.i.198]